MPQLSTLFAMYMSDKGRNGYSSLYNALFLHMKDSPIRLLEVGTGTMIPGAHSSMKGYTPDHYQPGASLRAWRDFFARGEIHGVDIAPTACFQKAASPRIYAILPTLKAAKPGSKRILASPSTLS